MSGPRRVWLALTLALAPASLGAQTLELTLKDAVTGRPVADAEAVLSNGARGVLASRWTDLEGQVRFSFVPGDTATVSVSALGYEALSWTIVPDPGPYPVVLWLNPAPIRIPGLELTVPSPQLALNLRGFQRRSVRGFGDFLGPEEIGRIVAVDASDYVRRLPGLLMIGGREPVFNKGGSGFRGLCTPALVLDGILVREANKTYLKFDDVVSPHDIVALEAYWGSAGLPQEWAGSGSGCGVILIWTKR